MNRIILLCVGILTGYKTYAADCGKPTVPPVIEDTAEAHDAVPHSWPWHVHLNYLPSKNYIPIQAGVIIDSEWIIADADALGFLNDPATFKAYLGFNNVASLGDEDETGGVVRDIEKIVIHPNYTSGQHDFDVALVKLAGGPLIFSDQIKPVCLLPDAQLDDVISKAQVGVVTGWEVRTLSEAKAVRQKLQQLRAPLVNSSDCVAMFNEAVGPSAVCYHSDVIIQEYGAPLVVSCGAEQWCLAGLGALIYDFPDVRGVAMGRPFCDFVKETVGKDLCVSL